MPNPNRLTRGDLINWAANCANGVANGVVTGFLAAQNTAFSDALTDANAELAAAETTCVANRALYLDAANIAIAKADAVLLIAQNIKDTMKGVNSPGDQYALLGYEIPKFVATPVIPQDPTELAAFGYSNGVNKLSFSGNNVPGSVTYVIEAKIGDTAPFVMVGTTQAQKWDHIGVTPGQYYEYRVCAQVRRNVRSMWSNSAVVYAIP